MQIIHIIKSIIFLLIVPICSSWAQLTGPYFNLPFPSTTVTRFAPNIFTQEFHAPPIFSPDGTEVYWNSIESGYPHILYMKLENGIWTDPAVAPFCFGDFTDSPFITSDGTKLFFLTMNQPTYEESICMVQKHNGEWGAAQILGDELNQFGPHWQSSVADNQNLYFGGRLNNSPGDIYFSEYMNNNYTLAIKLDSSINTNNGFEGSPFIAPDESYLIFDRIADGTNDADLFISFKRNDGSWSQAVALSELNTGAHEIYANVSPNGHFIMFLSGRTGILLPYWIDAQIINNYVTGIDDKQKTENSKTFKLHQNYPNPFNPKTRIPFSLTRSAFVEINVFDISGKKVKRLLAESKIKGNHFIEMDASDLAAGVYIYRIKAEKSIESKKLIILK